MDFCVMEYRTGTNPRANIPMRIYAPEGGLTKRSSHRLSYEKKFQRKIATPAWRRPATRRQIAGAIDMDGFSEFSAISSSKNHSHLETLMG